MKEEVLEDDFEDKQTKILMSFNLQGEHEQKKLEYIAKKYSVNKSAMIRQLILKEYKRLENGSADV